MKTSKQVSVYSKMFLVTPSVYEKLLTCLDEKEKRLIEDMNIDKDIPVAERPAEKYIEMLTKEELEPQQQQSIIPEITAIPEQQIIKPEIIQPVIQPEIIQPEIIQPEIIQQPQISTTPVQIPEVEKVKKPRFIAPRGDFTCSVCLKTFDRSWSLKRHMSTVHKNLQSLLQQPQEIQPAVLPQPLVPPIQVIYGDNDDMPLAQLRRQIKAKRMQQGLPDDDEDMPLAELRRQIREKRMRDEEDLPLAELRRRFKAKRLQQMRLPVQQPLDNPLKQPCRLQAEQLPEKVIFQPKSKILMPTIRKSKNIGARLKLRVPQIITQSSEPMFDDWGVKKARARTSSQAKLPEKPAKWRPSDQDFPSWQ